MQHFTKLQRAKQTQRHQDSRLALRNLFKATRDWGLDRRESLALAGISSLHQIGHWSSSADDILLTDDQVEIISYLLTLHRAVALRNPRQNEMEKWIKHADPQQPELEGKSPLEYLQKHPSKLLAAKTLSHLVCQEKD